MFWLSHAYRQPKFQTLVMGPQKVNLLDLIPEKLYLAPFLFIYLFIYFIIYLFIYIFIYLFIYFLFFYLLSDFGCVNVW